MSKEDDFWRAHLDEDTVVKDLSDEELAERLRHHEQLIQTVEKQHAEALAVLRDRNPALYDEAVKRWEKTRAELERLLLKAQSVRPGPGSPQ